MGAGGPPFGKERDSESGLDHFKYRNYASSMGRWMSPDPSQLRFANLGDPQSLNLYIYVGNNPINRVDLDGLCWKGFQWACNVGQRFDNLVHGDGFRTNKGVEDWYHKNNARRRNREVPGGAWNRTLHGGNALGPGGRAEIQGFCSSAGLPGVCYDLHSHFGWLGILGNENDRYFVTFAGTTYLYEKLGPNGEHLKYGITDEPANRYTQEELKGGKLKILAQGERGKMLELERSLHETMPIGPEEGQGFYVDIQVGKGYSPPPYDIAPK